MFYSHSLFGEYPKGREVSIRFFSSQVIHCLPGEIVTLQASICNQTMDQLTLNGRVLSPHEITPLPSNPLLFHLNPGEINTQSLTLKIANEASPGEYDVVYEIENYMNPQIQDRNGFTVIVMEPSIAELPVVSNSLIVPEKEEDPSKVIEVTLTNDRLIKAKPGDVLTISTLVMNRGVKRKIFGEFITPKGWTLTPAEKFETEIDSDRSDLQIIAVKLPEQTLAGQYPLKIHIQDNEKQHQDADEIYIDVESTIQLNCAIAKKPLLCACGEDFEVSIEIANNGNTPLRLLLDIRSEPACARLIDDERFTIQPGEVQSRTFCLKGATDYKCYEQYLFFRVKDETTGAIMWQQAATFPIIPKGMPDIDPSIRIPTVFRGAVVAQRGQFSLVPEFSGGGLIDEENNRHCEFVFRAPTHPRNVIYEQYQRYYARVWEDDWDFLMGDTIYDLSPLLERWRYGRGTGFAYTHYPYGCGFFYAQDIFNTECNLKEFGSFLQYQLSDSSTGWLNYMHKEYSNYPQSDLLGAEYEYALNADNFSHLEVAHDFIDTRCKRGKNGYSILLRGRYRHDSWYSVEKSYAGHSFFGTYRDLDLFAANIDTGITSQLRVNCSVNFLKQGLDIWEMKQVFGLDPYTVTAPHQQQYNTQITYSFLNGCNAALTGLIFNAKDESFHPQYNFKQRWGGLNLGFNRENDSFLVVTSFGQQKDLLGRKQTNGLQKYYFYYTRNFTTKLQGSLLYDMGNIDYYDAKPWRYGFGGSMRYFYDRSSWISLFAQKVKMYPSNVNMSQLASTLAHFFSNGHQLAFSGQYFLFDNQRTEWQLLVSYSIPFDAPIAKRKDIGCLQGKIFEKGSSRPIPNALVALGEHKALSDANGIFGFQGITPGEYDFKTEILPNNLITQDPSAMRLNVLGGQQAFMELATVRSCTIRGEIYQYAYSDDLESQQQIFYGKKAPLEKQNGVSGIRVIAQNEATGEGFSCMTTTNGCFHFKELRPGRWKLSVIEDDLPEQTQVEQGVFEVIVEPGEEESVLFKIIPEQRIIHPLSKCK